MSKRGRRCGKPKPLPSRATDALLSWLLEHAECPYPSQEEREELAKNLLLTKKQVTTWFVNARRRVLGIHRRRGIVSSTPIIPKTSSKETARTVLARGQMQRRPTAAASCTKHEDDTSVTVGPIDETTSRYSEDGTPSPSPERRGVSQASTTGGTHSRRSSSSDQAPASILQPMLWNPAAMMATGGFPGLASPAVAAAAAMAMTNPMLRQPPYSALLNPLGMAGNPAASQYLLALQAMSNPWLLKAP